MKTNHYPAERNKNMDLSETNGVVQNRHPWELSRTKCTIKAFDRYLEDGPKSYINAGAGDCYFDKILLATHKQYTVHAIDIAYKNLDPDQARIFKYHRLEDVPINKCDYAIMMDSLEYMEDDVAYVKNISEKIKPGGYFFLTLPAFPILFSDYDVNIKNLRRYSRKSFERLIAQVTNLTIVEEYNFYTSLFMVRFVQKILHLPIDPKHNFTANWKHGEKSFLTVFLTACLNLDFGFNKLLSSIGIRLPGLSMLAVCKKNQ